LIKVKRPLESTAADTFVPATVTVTPDALKARRPVLEAPDAPETTPTMVAPALAGVDVGVVMMDGVLPGAVGDP
jgi:hypothetical protein